MTLRILTVAVHGPPSCMNGSSWDGGPLSMRFTRGLAVLTAFVVTLLSWLPSAASEHSGCCTAGSEYRGGRAIRRSSEFSSITSGTPSSTNNTSTHMMEVDMQSPPPTTTTATFRPSGTVAFATKRPRSPGSPTLERPCAKRLSLAPSVGSLEHRHVRRAPITSISSSTSASVLASNGTMVATGQDDWVRQAKELTIASPLSVVPECFPSVSISVPAPALSAGGAGAPGVAQSCSRVDEHMAVDYEDSPTFRIHAFPGSPPRSWMATRSHLPSIHISTTTTVGMMPTHSHSHGVNAGPNGLYALSPAPFSVLAEPPSSSSTEPVSSTSSIAAPQANAGVGAREAHIRLPDIYLLPATPSDTPSHDHRFTGDAGQRPTRGERGESEPGHARMQQDQQNHHHHPQSSSCLLARAAQDRIEGSPQPVKAPDLPTSSGRKHRVTMGPRADCVKCRAGVKGHWMHFD